jgi:signal peptidase
MVKMGKDQKDGLKEAVLTVAIAMLTVAVLLGGMYAYSGNWPPMVVVESGSMQHSSTYAYLGDLNIGDMVLVKKVSSASQIVTYVQGVAKSYSTYGEAGNVIIYKPYGSDSVVPIIHRAIVYIQYNSSGGGYDIPSLLGLPLSQWYVMSPQGQAHYAYNIKYNVKILNVGYTHTPVIIPVAQMIQRAKFSGFITMGDHNHAVYGENATDQALQIFPLPVKIQWVEGVAQGLLPYVGLVKLMFTGGLPPGTPQNSVDALVVIVVSTIASVVAGQFVFEYWISRRHEKSGEDRDTDGKEKSD